MLGFGVTRLDDIATIALIGCGPVFLALSSPSWMGPWLRRTAWIVGVAASPAVVAIFTYSQMTYGFLLVPVGLIWTLSAGIKAARAGIA